MLCAARLMDPSRTIAATIESASSVSFIVRNHRIDTEVFLIYDFTRLVYHVNGHC